MTEDKQPTNTETRASDDSLNRKDFVDNLCEAIMAPLPQTPIANGTIFLEGGYGTGKTFVMRWMQEELKTRNEAPHIVYFDAWRNENANDPLSPLLQTLSKPNLGEKALKALSFLAKYALIMKGLPPIDLEQILKELKQKDEEGFRWLRWFKSRKSSAQDATPLIQEIKENKFREALKDYIEALPRKTASDAPELIVFVDELDRCRPDYALTFLEKIRHLFDVEGIVFVVAADMRAIEDMVKLVYNSTNPKNYLRKFYDRKLPLPSFRSRSFIHKLLIEANKKFELGYLNQRVVSHFVFLANLLKLDLRRLMYAVRELAIAIDSEVDDEQANVARAGYAMDYYRDKGSGNTHRPISLPGFPFLYISFVIFAVIRQYDEQESHSPIEAVKTDSSESLFDAFLEVLAKKATSLSPIDINDMYANSDTKHGDYAEFMLQIIPALKSGSEPINNILTHYANLVTVILEQDQITNKIDGYTRWFEHHSAKGSYTLNLHKYYELYRAAIIESSPVRKSVMVAEKGEIDATRNQKNPHPYLGKPTE